MCRDILSSEKGFSAAFMVLLIATMGLLGVGATMILQNEAIAIGDQYTVRYADYAAESAFYYALGRAKAGNTVETESVTINGIVCTYDNSEVGGAIQIITSAPTDNDEISSSITASARIMPISQIPLWTADDAEGIFRIYDNGGTRDDGLCQTDADSVPQFNTAYFWANADEQHATAVTVNSDFPSGATDFWQAPGIPWITYVRGDLTVRQEVDLYGIFIVQGDITIRKGVDIHGVVYQPDAGSEFKINLGLYSYDIDGGLIINGDLNHNGLSYLDIRHDQNYMNAFYTQYAHATEPSLTRIESWTYGS